MANPALVAARRDDDGAWEIVLVRYGRLVGTTRVPRGADPLPAVEALEATGEAVPEPSALCGAASAEESDLVAAWLEQPGVRLVRPAAPEPPWAWRVDGPERFLAELTATRPAAR